MTAAPHKTLETLKRLKKVQKTLKTIEDIKNNPPKTVAKKKNDSSKKTKHKAGIKGSKINITPRYKR